MSELPITTPRIMICLEGMQYAIQHAMLDYGNQLSKEVQAELESAIKGFDFKGYVVQNARFYLEEEIKGAIKQAISKAVWEDRGFKSMIETEVRATLLGMFNKQS